MSSAKPPFGRFSPGVVSFVVGAAGVVFTLLFLVAVIAEGQGVWSSNGYVAILLYSVAFAIYVVTLVLAIRTIRSAAEGRGFAVAAIALISVPFAVMLVLLVSFFSYLIKMNVA
ncbi:hypothetical protein FE783_14780 [Paenibacillus mesophilus]|uniref:hypothetical protein n=1 Tax=Paenibacillus mesophilus TaxID=2582849 RepID=UPI00110E6930|nr:hypothetical protein [Paenibacillus mesophilus]TMV48936.1 hypothetical protein FE783_14780 [Paenibacillus mesophilus]